MAEQKDITKEWKQKVIEMLSKVPGYTGYIHREGLRDEDKLVRSFIANDLNRVKGRLLDLGVPMAEREPENAQEFEKIIDVIHELDRTSQELDKVIDKIRFATYGYSGLFDAKEINEQELEKLKEFDKSLANYSSVIEESIIPVQEAIYKKADIGEPLLNTNRIISELETKFYEREKIIKGGS